MTTLEDLIQVAKAWMEQDPDPETKQQTAELIDSSDVESLTSQFSSRIGFGTAGLRGELGAGPNRMNRVLVSQAASGIANWLAAKSQSGKVVIGYDARRNSKQFAIDSAEIISAQGHEVFLFEDLAATPLLAYAVRELGCDVGIMVTASHNPRNDNGYKVYESSGSQIVSPVDVEISKEIESVAKNMSVLELPRSDSYKSVPNEVIESYLDRMARLWSSEVSRKELKIVYSAMHGVGATFLMKLFGKLGLRSPIPVTSQIEPDGTFPTVPFPNPEEKGAMDHSLQTAQESNADLILVNDPDADRLAVVYRAASGELMQLTGDEVGLLLGEELAGRANAQGISGNLACSIVSSSALAEIAKAHGLGFEQTLTGFKWISRVQDLIFGYEEALGYCVDWENVRDKDGLSAALLVTDIATRLAKDGLTLGDELERIRRRDGYFVTGQISIRVSDLAIISELMKKLRQSPPQEIAGNKAEFLDLALGSAKLQPTDGVLFNLSDGGRVIVRPSGTEPKLKCYLQATATNEVQAKEKLEQLNKAMKEVLA